MLATKHEIVQFQDLSLANWEVAIKPDEHLDLSQATGYGYILLKAS